MLANEEVLAPVYYILGGTKSGEVSKKNNQEIRKKIIFLLCVFDYWYFRVCRCLNGLVPSYLHDPTTKYVLSCSLRSVNGHCLVDIGYKLTRFMVQDHFL